MGLREWFSKDKKRLSSYRQIAKAALDKVHNGMDLWDDVDLQDSLFELRRDLISDSASEYQKIKFMSVVAEVVRRKTGLLAYEEQLMGALTLIDGDVAEMSTGSGKSLTSIFAATFKALLGKKVYIVTVNEYLAERDYKAFKEVYDFLGVGLSLVKSVQTLQEKQKAYNHAVIYVTHSELGFDYLRDNLVHHKIDKVLDTLDFALIDEVDSILIDEARTPLIISGNEDVRKATGEIIRVNNIIAKHFTAEDYVIHKESKQVDLTDLGVDKICKHLNLDNLFSVDNRVILTTIKKALTAHYTLQKDVDYVVGEENGKKVIQLVDVYTGRIMEGRRYSEGLHQAIEAKEKLDVVLDNRTVATISYQNFFKLFAELSGMTGTAKTEEDEFLEVYNMHVLQIPDHKPTQRVDNLDIIFATKSAKWVVVASDIVKRHKQGKGQPILVGTASIEDSEFLSNLLTKNGVKHVVLNAKNHAKEAEIIAEAGQLGAVTIATNMAGRGTDIRLSGPAKEAGGLYVIGTERFEARRIDNQLRGRSGRQGDVGESQFYVSLEDELLYRYSDDKMVEFMEKYDNRTPDVVQKILQTQINSLQMRSEGLNFDSRKFVMEYDNIVRAQRELIYSFRDFWLEIDDLDRAIDLLHLTYFDVVMEMVSKSFAKKDVDGFKDLQVKLVKDFSLEGLVDNASIELVTNTLSNKLRERIDFLKGLVKDDKLILDVIRYIVLSEINIAWVNWLEQVEDLRNSMTLRSFGQMNPLLEFNKEASVKFKELYSELQYNIVRSYVMSKVDLERRK